MRFDSEIEISRDDILHELRYMSNSELERYGLQKLHTCDLIIDLIQTLKFEPYSYQAVLVERLRKQLNM